jgi:hypothetical protein
MQKHTNRLLVAAVLVAAGVIGGFFVFRASSRAASADTAGNATASQLDRMIVTANEIGSAPQAYVAPGQPDQPWRDRSAILLQQFGQDAVALRTLLQPGEAAAALDQIDASFKALVMIDSRARANMQEGQNLLAADLIFSDGHDVIGLLITTLSDLRASQRALATSQRAAAEQQQWIALGSVAGVWLVGLLVLASGGRRDPATPGHTTRGMPSVVPDSFDIPRLPPVDLGAAADVCDALARTADAAALREVLGRAAAVLHARGIIVWMGAGEELFPALSYGYDERVVERLGAIPRNAANATAEAWRTAQMRTVASGIMSHGAIAAPLSGITGCVGVLAAEVGRGHEDEPAVRAVATMIAAQLTAILPAWPAASARPQRPDSPALAASGS